MDGLGVGRKINITGAFEVPGKNMCKIGSEGKN